jgi:hypothetical protein
MDLANPDGTTTPIPDEQLPAMLAAGKIAAPGPMTMVRPDGTPGTVPQEDVQRALQSGFKLVGADEAQHIADVREAAQHPAEAFGVGVAQGLIPKAPDIIQALGGPDLEKQRNLAEGNPLATPAGRITGNVGQAVIGGLLTGGASDVAEGASLGSKVFDAADMAKQAAIFGAQGASNEINEQDLGDHGYNGEAVVSQAGLGALLGAASSPAFALAKEVMPNPITAAGKAIAKASDALSAAVGKGAAAGRGLNGEGESVAKEIYERSVAGEKNPGLATKNAAAVDGARAFDARDDAADTLLKSAFGDQHPAAVAELAQEDALQSGHTVTSTTKGVDTFMANFVNPTLSKMAAGVEAGELAPNIIKPAKDALIRLAENAGEATDVPQYVAAVRQAELELNPLMKYGHDLAPSIDKSTVGFIEQSIRSPLRDLIRSPEVFGPRVADANAKLIDAARDVYRARDAVDAGLGKRDLLAPGRPSEQIKTSPSKFLNYVSNQDKLTQADNIRYSNAYDTAIQHLADVTTELARAGKQTVDTDAIQNLIQDAAAKKSRAVAAAEMTKGGGDAVGGLGLQTAAGVIGSAIGGPVGGAIGATGAAAYKAVRYPASTLQMLGKIKALADKHTADIARAASSFFTGTGRVVAPVVAGNALRAGKDYQEHDSDTERQMAEVRTLSSNPGLLENTLRRNTSALMDEAPVTSLAVTTNAQARLKVLRAALPPAPPQGMIPGKVPTSIDATQHFDRTLQVVNHPAKAIQSAMVDENLTPDMVAAADASAPKTMAAIRQAFQSEMVDRYDHEYTLGQQQQLSVLFKAPVTPFLAPDMTAFLQATYAPPAPTPPPGMPGKPRASGMAKLDAGKAIATPSQARQMEAS